MKLFELPEYESSFREFMNKINEVLVSDKDPLLSEVPRRKVSRLYIGRNSHADGGIHNSPVMPITSTFQLTAAEIVECDGVALGRRLDAFAEEYLASLMPQFFGAMNAAIESAGNSTDAGGKPLSADMLVDVLERMELDFDEDGNVHLQLIANPLTALPEFTKEAQERIDSVIQRKREEFLARRRSRKLPRDPFGG